MPKKPSNIRQLWINAIKEQQNFTEIDDNTLNYSVCNEHFDDSNIATLADNRKRLLPGAIPNHFTTNESTNSRNAQSLDPTHETPPIEPTAISVCEQSWYFFLVNLFTIDNFTISCNSV